jgi:hypothetical protein
MVTISRNIDENSSKIMTIVVGHKEDLNPVIDILDDLDKDVEMLKVIASYEIPTGGQVIVDDEKIISVGALLTKTPRSASKTFFRNVNLRKPMKWSK